MIFIKISAEGISGSCGLMQNLHHDMKHRNNLDEEEIFAKDHSLRGTLVPYSVGANMKLIRRAGFQEVEVFFKWYNWVGILAVK